MNNRNLNNLTAASTEEKKSTKVKNPIEDIVKESTCTKETKQHFKDTSPNLSKNECGKNFHIQQPSSRSGNN